METHKFKYPIFPDRVYTIKTDLVHYKVYGSLLIRLYKDHLADLIPPDEYTPDYDDRLF